MMTAKEKREQFELELQVDKMKLEVKNIDLELLKIDERVESYQIRKQELLDQLTKLTKGDNL